MHPDVPWADFKPLFEELWVALGPANRAEYDRKAAVYHNALKDIPIGSLEVAVERCIRNASTRLLPAPGALRMLANTHLAEISSALNARAKETLPDVPLTHCACRCGGRRWYEVLRDRVTGEVRRYPADIATQAVPAAAAAGAPGYRAELEALAGQPMLRVHVSCKRIPSAVRDPEPRHGYIGLEQGSPVFDPNAPPRTRPQEAA